MIHRRSIHHIGTKVKLPHISMRKHFVMEVRTLQAFLLVEDVNELMSIEVTFIFCLTKKRKYLSRNLEICEISHYE